MNPQVVTLNNITKIEYLSLMTLLHDIYAKDLPEVSMNIPADSQELDRLMRFFANQYAYIIELWARMVHEVRLLKRLNATKEEIAEAMDKRDYLEMIMSACKLKHFACSQLLKHNRDEKMI